MNTANKITMIRVFLVPRFMVLFMIDNVTCHYAALGVFVLASITDAIDGLDEPGLSSSVGSTG